jgi:hypothetical protein
MRNRFFGVLSILFVFVSFKIGIIVIAFSNPPAAGIYSVLVTVSVFIIIYSYCTKCPHVSDGTCRHVVFGKIAKIFRRRNGGYGRLDLFGTVIPMTVILSVPQFWLVRSPVIMAVFWAFIIAGVFLIVLFVCRECKNTNCMNCPLKGKEPIR